jgi:voltage-gated potassium channel
MISLGWLLRRLKRKRSLGVAILLLVLVGSIAGNALTFFYFDRGSQPDLTVSDAFWYSVISITTIGYGDLSATTTGARIGTVVFIVVLGLAAFTSAIGLGVDWLLEYNYREKAGMGKVVARNHVLIVNYPNERRVRQIVEEFLRDPGHRNDELVIVTDQIESLPFEQHNVYFVRGAPLEEETYLRANAKEARQAIVLSTGYDDPSSDSVAASVVSILEHVNPEISIVAEVLDAGHSLLFDGTKNTSIVHTFRMSNNLLVQEAQDPGVTLLTQAITSNQQVEGTLASTRIETAVQPPPSYRDVAISLLGHDVNLVGVIRGENVHLRFEDISLTENDRLVYICPTRHDWETLRSFLG